MTEPFDASPSPERRLLSPYDEKVPDLVSTNGKTPLLKRKCLLTEPQLYSNHCLVQQFVCTEKYDIFNGMINPLFLINESLFPFS